MRSAARGGFGGVLVLPCGADNVRGHGLDLYKSRHLLTTADLPIFAVGMVVAFVSALLVLRAFIKFVSHAVSCRSRVSAGSRCADPVPLRRALRDAGAGAAPGLGVDGRTTCIDLAEAGAPAGTAVWRRRSMRAEAVAGGLGVRAGGLWLSVLWRGQPDVAQLLSIRAGLAVAALLDRWAGCHRRASSGPTT